MATAERNEKRRWLMHSYQLCVTATPPSLPVHLSTNVFKYIYPDFNNAKPPLLCRSWVTPSSTHSLWLERMQYPLSEVLQRQAGVVMECFEARDSRLISLWDFLAKLLSTTIGGINNELETGIQWYFFWSWEFCYNAQNW